MTKIRYIYIIIVVLACFLVAYAVFYQPEEEYIIDAGLRDQNDNVFPQSSMLEYYNIIYFSNIVDCAKRCRYILKLADSAVKKVEKFNSNIPIRSLFVTTDPINDNPAKLKVFLLSFKDMLGITGSEKDLNKFIKDYRMYYRNQYDQDEYLVANLYLTGKDGNVLDVVSINLGDNELNEQTTAYEVIDRLFLKVQSDYVKK